MAEYAAHLRQQLPAPRIHGAGLEQAQIEARLQADRDYQQLTRERLAGNWFAALISTNAPDGAVVRGRFDSWVGLMEYLAEREVLVEIWAPGEGPQGEARRLTAAELSHRQGQRHEGPTFVTVTLHDPAVGELTTYRVEFGFQAAQRALATVAAYERHRRLQLLCREILAAKDSSSGLPDALAQWEKLQATAADQRVAIAARAPRPRNRQDPYVAVEYHVDEQGLFAAVAQFLPASALQPRVRDRAQVLELRAAPGQTPREALGFQTRGVSDRLEPAPYPISGLDPVELRIRDPRQPDPRRWNVLEFGESALVRESALARFALLNAHLEWQRKRIAGKRANLALVAEPLIAALNIGGGLAGLGFPAGEAGRLLYNVLAWQLIADVPRLRQMRELFAVMAARDRHPQLRAVPERFLAREDIRQLEAAGRQLTDVQIDAYLAQMSDDDLRAMLLLAQMGLVDARITGFLNLLTSALRVSKVSEQPGVWRDLFNNVRFALNGELNLKTLAALAAGQRVLTPLSGTSLEDLSRGRGPARAWLQYLEVSVDVRAIVNTLVRLTKPTFARKELEKPLPYAPRLSDLAAYEIRIFGFPLFLFYKRGLIKADLEAYENDYAYGLIGTRLVERFPTRASMETEIRAGRMVPLGYVRVPDGRGGWKPTHLAVFGHRIPSGKHEDKTAVVIYGLKAYREHSQLVERELERLRQFEQGLRDGAVIEQIVGAPPETDVPSATREPEVHVGAEAVAYRYQARLAHLIEGRRQALRSSWGLADEPELRRSESNAPFAEWPSNGSHEAELVAVDRFHSSFIYRRTIDGQPQEVKVVLIPSLAQIERAQEKATEAAAIEQWRRETAAGQRPGLALLNEAIPLHDRWEMGPLLRDANGAVVGAGVRAGPEAFEAMLDAVDRLPCSERARFQFNRYAATLLELDLEGDGQAQRVFLTLEFPLGEVQREWTHPLTGVRQTLRFEDGRWRRAISEDRILELEYDDQGTEVRSRSFANAGSRQAPQSGRLIEETVTTDVWWRDLSKRGLDPYEPNIAKVRINHVTGQVTHETYGLFPLPVQTVDEFFITRSRYTAEGHNVQSKMWDNGVDAADFQRSRLAKLLEPITGRPRFALASQAGVAPGSADRPGLGRWLTLQRDDLVKGITQTVVIDLALEGRTVSQGFTDPFDGTTNSFAVTTAFEYDDAFHAGLVPARSITRAATGFVLTRTTTLAYDPVTGRLTAREVEHTGKVRTNTWLRPWPSPVEVLTQTRRTVNRHSQHDTQLEDFVGTYDPTNRLWHLERTPWHRPGIPRAPISETRSAFGRLIALRVGDTYASRPVYDQHAAEVKRLTFRHDPTAQAPALVHLAEEDYRWLDGHRDARIVTFFHGREWPYDEYRRQTDADGRTVVDGIRSLPGLELRTELTHDGHSDRVIRSEVFQNGQNRLALEALPEIQSADGAWLLRFRSTPSWGLVATNTYRADDPVGRPLARTYENGDSVRVLAWFPFTALARVSEVQDREGRRQERRVHELRAGVMGLPYDLITRYTIDPWGEPALSRREGLVCGTDIALFEEHDENRVLFDLSAAYRAPRLAVAGTGRAGRTVWVAGRRQPHVTDLFRSELQTPPANREANSHPERVLIIERMGLRGLFYHPVHRQRLDRSGRLLEEVTSRIPAFEGATPTEPALWAAADGAAPEQRWVYHCQPGYWVEAFAAPSGVLTASFATQPAPAPTRSWPVNHSGWRQVPTEILGYRRQPDATPQRGPIPPHPTADMLFRRQSAPRLWQQNPHLPGVSNAWMSWTTTAFGADGQARAESDTFFDAAGRVATTLVRQPNSRRQSGTRLAYVLPQPARASATNQTPAAGPAQWRHHNLAVGVAEIPVELAGERDVSRCDFLAVYFQGQALGLRLTDARGRGVVAAHLTRHPGAPGSLGLWPPSAAHVLWLPTPILPTHGASLSAPYPWVDQDQVLAVAVPHLAQAGLDVHRLTSATVLGTAVVREQAAVSGLFELAHGGPVRSPATDERPQFQHQHNSSGLTTFTTRVVPRRGLGRPSTAGQISRIEHRGRRVGLIHPHAWQRQAPVFTLLDDSPPDPPQPLYSIAAAHGRFVEYYRAHRAEDTHIYTVAHGFGPAKLEVYRSGVLDDETAPGALAFGGENLVSLPLDKAAGALAGSLATLNNRCAASVFTLCGERLLGRWFAPSPRAPQFAEWTRRTETAAAQAAEVRRLPMLASALLPLQELPESALVPGQTAGTSPPAPLAVRTASLKAYLNLLSARYPRTGLIPTSLGTAAEPFVDTVGKAQLIKLAVQLREPSLAGALLSFYWERSQGGTQRLHAAYDARHGAALTLDPAYPRPIDAAQTAAAHVAIAEAAFELGLATSDTHALEFGQNLVTLLLEQYRPAPRRHRRRTLGTGLGTSPGSTRCDRCGPHRPVRALGSPTGPGRAGRTRRVDVARCGRPDPLAVRPHRCKPKFAPPHRPRHRGPSPHAGPPRRPRPRLAGNCDGRPRAACARGG